MSMTEWAKREVEIASKRERGDKPESEWDYMDVLAMIVLLRLLRAFVETVTVVLVSALQRGSLTD